MCLWSCFTGHYSVHSMINFQWERYIAVLMLAQCLRCWPNIEPTLAECTSALLSIHIRGVNCFAIPAVIKSVSLQTWNPAKSQSLGNFGPIKVGDFVNFWPIGVGGLRFWLWVHPLPPPPPKWFLTSSKCDTNTQVMIISGFFGSGHVSA